METSVKYSLNPLASCFVPLSMKDHTGSITGDVYSFEFENPVCPVYRPKDGVLPFSRNKKSNDYKTTEMRENHLDIIQKEIIREELFVIRNTLRKTMHDMTEATTEKLNGNETSTERSENRSGNENMSLMESERTENKTATLNMGMMESERTENKTATLNMDCMESERKEDKTATLNIDSIELKRMDNRTTTWIMDSVESEQTYKATTQVIDSLEMERIENRTATWIMGSMESERSENMTSTESIGLMESDGTENMSSMELDILPAKKRLNWLDRDLHYGKKSNSTLSLYLTILLSSILSSESKFSKNESCSSEIVEAEKSNDKAEKEECRCPSMFGWIVPLEYFGNPLRLTETCSKKYVHTTYEHTTCDHMSCVPRPYFKYLDEMEKNSIDSGRFSDEDEPSDLIDEAFTLEQCSWELEAIIKDVCDSVDQSLLSCDDGERLSQTADSKTTESPLWQTGGKMEVTSLDSTIVDDGHHPLLQDIPSVDEGDIEVSSIEKFLGEALTFGEKHSNRENLPEQPSCILPCSIWCNNVPTPAIDTYKRFIKKLDSESIHRSVTDENRKIPRKPIYKRCFSADDTPKSLDYDQVLVNLVSSSESNEQLRLLRKDPVAFKDFNGVAPVDSNRKSISSNFIFEKVTKTFSNEKGSDTWSLVDNADSMWQPLPECVQSNEHSLKYFHKRARDLRRQKSVG